MRRRVGSRALAKIPAATRHTRLRRPPPLLAHNPRRNNASLGHGNGRRRGRQRPSPDGGRGGRQQHASNQRGVVSRGPRQRYVLQADALRNRIMCKKSVDPHGGRGCSRTPLRSRAKGRRPPPAPAVTVPGSSSQPARDGTACTHAVRAAWGRRSRRECQTRKQGQENRAAGRAAGRNVPSDAGGQTGARAPPSGVDE